MSIRINVVVGAIVWRGRLVQRERTSRIQRVTKFVVDSRSQAIVVARKSPQTVCVRHSCCQRCRARGSIGSVQCNDNVLKSRLSNLLNTISILFVFGMEVRGEAELFELIDMIETITSKEKKQIKKRKLNKFF